MTSGIDWQAIVGRSWAEMYRQTDRSFAGLTQRLIERILPLPGRALLDIGCGAGELTLALARTRPGAEIVGLDVSRDLIAVARARGSEHPEAVFVEGDAATWERPGFAPELLVSRHGVMFFADPLAAFTHLHRIAAPEANLVFSCFRSSRENPWASEVAGFLPQQADAPPTDPNAPGPFSFASPSRVENILEASGWSSIDFEAVDYAFIAGQGDDPVGDAAAFMARIGPAAAALRQMEGAVGEAVMQRLRHWLEANRSGDLVAFQAAAWIVSARKG